MLGSLELGGLQVVGVGVVELGDQLLLGLHPILDFLYLGEVGLILLNQLSALDEAVLGVDVGAVHDRGSQHLVLSAAHILLPCALDSAHLLPLSA